MFRSTRVFTFSMLLVTSCCAAGQSPTSRFISGHADDIEKFLQSKFSGSDAGMVIGVIDKFQRRVFSAGKLDDGTNQQIEGDTIFPLGSVTKVFTSLLLLDAVQRGKIKLDDPVANYLPSSDDGSRIGHWNFQAMIPAGALFSTANDMLKFLGAQLGLTKTDLAPQMRQSHEAMHTDSTEFGTTAMPWYDNGIYSPPGTQLLGHAGHGLGCLAFVAIDVNNKRGVVVLTNQIKIHPNPVGWTIL